MCLIDEHRATRLDKQRTVMHEFRLRYRRDNRVIYGFVEGKDDPSFYRGFIESNLPQGWKAELWQAGNKDNVNALYAKFDWRSFKKEQILFFIDRDLSDFTEEEVPNETNIYVTDNYSIENDIVDSTICDRLVREICGFTNLEYENSDKIENQFNAQLEKFQDSLIKVMAHIIYWRKKSYNACLNDIYMKHIFSVQNGVLVQKDRPKNKASVIDYIYDQCNQPKEENEEIEGIEQFFQENNLQRKFTRGKYLLWFAVEFCLSIHRDCLNLEFISLDKKPKMVVNLSQSNGVALMAPRSRMTQRLIDFLNITMNKYIEIKEAA